MSRPFCVDASFDLSGNIDAAARSGVRKVQLVFLGYEGSDPGVFPGKTVRATGELFGAHTGHHHADVLMSVTQLDPAGHSSAK